MSLFEILMLLCFGLAWPFSIVKAYRARRNDGKSVWFLFIVLVGYAAGIVHKLTRNLDGVVYLYSMNGLMVLADILIFYRNRWLVASGVSTRGTR